LGRYRIYLDESAKNLARCMYKIYYQNYTSSTSTSQVVEKTKTTEVSNNIDMENAIVADWRELIYQMALDFDACGQDDNYSYKLRLNNPTMINGKTGYE
jgi:hypothetical protein